MDQKMEYETPTLVAHGSFEEITQLTTVGNRLDADFPSDTPLDSVTFS